MKKNPAPLLLVLAASCWIFIGTFALYCSHNTYISAVQYSGVVLLLNGLLLLAVSYSCDSTQKEKRWIRAESIPDLLFSVLLLLDPVFSLFAFPYLVGPWIVAKGLLTMIASLALAKDIHGWKGDFTGGFFLISCGLLISHNPMENPFGVNVLIGAIGVTIGLLYLYDAFRFRKIPVFHAMA